MLIAGKFVLLVEFCGRDCVLSFVARGGCKRAANAFVRMYVVCDVVCVGCGI